jgi:site-specific recombinase XerD
MKQTANVPGNLRQIREELTRRLVMLRYSKESTSAYLRILNWIEEFLNGYGEASYSKEMGQRFIAEYALQPHHTPTQFRSSKTVIKRIDEILDNQPLSPNFVRTKPECSPRFLACYDKYLAHLNQTGITEATKRNYRRYAVQLLSLLPESVKAITELMPKDLYDVFKKRHTFPAGMYVVARSFLTFLFENGATKSNLSGCVPNLRHPQPLPSVYTGDEVSRLLSSVDRSDSMGKRDYAILMLAAHLGLRSCDIVNLAFSDIDRQKKIITLVQVKTSRPLALVLNNDVEEAITDYIENSRPKSDSDKIFLSTQAPFSHLCAGTGYAIAHKYFELAGISPQGRKRGPHALRMSYATALVNNGVPYSVVQEALGHDDPESAKHYVRVDIRRLRRCALTVPKPTGAFAVNLGDVEEVL